MSVKPGFDIPNSRFGVVRSHDSMGLEANAPLVRIEAEQHRSALAAVRSEASEDIKENGLVKMADMEHALHRVIKMHEGLSHFVKDLELEEVTSAYIGVIVNEILEDEKGELGPEDCEEFFTGLSELIPELKRVTDDADKGTGLYL